MRIGIKNRYTYNFTKMKTLKISLVVLVSIAWIYVTTLKIGPINSVGELFTYKTGLLSVPIATEGIKEVKSDYDSKIYIDDIGIPHIFSGSDNDAAFALGYAHAKDRYFQMEMVSRIVQGRLSEILSAQTIDSDIFWKPYEFEKKSEELLLEYQENFPEFYNYLQSYSDGVNTLLAEESDYIDPLYKIIGEKPRAWKTEYSLLFTWYMSWSLTYFDHHVDQQEVYDKLSQNTQDYFFPQQPYDLHTILPSEVNINELAVSPETVVSSLPALSDVTKRTKESPIDRFKDKLSKTHKFYQGIGSNNWVVNNIKSSDNGTILVNDPHLSLTLPEAFYEAHLVSDTFKVYGFTIPGVPVVVSGHNDKISWGITNGEWDLVDRYSLKVKNDSLYFYEDNWIPFNTKEYTLEIKGNDAYTFKNKTTVHGQVIEENDAYYSQHWYAADKSYSVKAIYDVMKSQKWDEFKDALQNYSYPPQNFVYGDIYDNIGIVCAGELPERDPNYRGQVLDGSTTYKENKALDSLWYTYNPDDKFLFSANQQPIQNDVYFGAHGLKDDYRVKRIYSLLQESNNWGVQKNKELQLDEHDLSFIEFQKLLSSDDSLDQKYKIAAVLKNWDGNMSSESEPALAYEVLRRSVELEASIFAENVLEVNKAPSFKYYVKYLNDKNFVIPNAPPKKELLETLLRKTDSLMQGYFGDTWEDVIYDNVSDFTVNNILFIPGLGESINGVGGNVNSVSMNSEMHHSVFRSIYEMKDGAISGQTIIAGGQSGLINSRHYKDQLKLWKEGEYKETQFENDQNKLENIINIIKFDQ